MSSSVEVQTSALPASLSLNGTWQLLPTDIFRQGFYPLDDESWLEQELPAHWQQHPLLAEYAGKLVYRKRFSLPSANLPADPRTRVWLRFNGVFYWLQPFFNGIDLGRREGYFMPHDFEVTRWVAEDNTLLVEVECPDENNKLAKRMITGVFSHWDCLDPATNPGGIWLPIELITTGPQRIGDVLLHTEQISDASATIRYRVGINSAEAAAVVLRWTFSPKNFAGEVQVIEQRQMVQAGDQELDATLRIRDPHLWWTHDLGDPNCYTVTLEVLSDDQVSDQRSVTFGIRRFEMRNWIAYLNGVRFLIKGNNYGPGDTRLATMTRERYERDLQLAREAHMNLLRVHAHVDHPQLYEAANLAGVLLWQDFPLQWLYSREVLEPARQQVRQMARQLYNHPAVVIWCMHNEPLYVTDTSVYNPLMQLRVYASVLLRSWNRDVLDNQLKRDIAAQDPTRPIVRASGEFYIPLLNKGTDSHFYMGWYTRVFGPLSAWEKLAQRFPANIRFVSEFGAQSFPNRESCLKFMPSDPQQVDWEAMRLRHQFQPSILESSLPWREVHDLDELILLTQSYQIAINRFYIDRLRYYKYRPTGGIVPFMFHDPNPAISFSIIDYWREPKRSYEAMKLAFSPQYVFLLLSQEHHPLGKPIDLPIYAVNDEHREVPVQVTARLVGPDERELATTSRSLTLAADCMAQVVDHLRLTPDQPGTYHVHLALREGSTLLLENEYAIVVDAT